MSGSDQTDGQKRFQTGETIALINSYTSGGKTFPVGTQFKVTKGCPTFYTLENSVDETATIVVSAGWLDNPANAYLLHKGGDFY